MNGNKTAFEVMYKAIYYSQMYCKPIHINELPAWHETRLKTLADNLCHAPNKICIYKLWDYYNSSEAIYALYNVYPEKGITEKVYYTFDVFCNVFGHKQAKVTVTPQAPYEIVKALLPLFMIITGLGILKRNV
ncbi:MAG: hypothetical protein QXY34_02425 [Candidatus Bathyarchaeia archaeon]